MAAQFSCSFASYSKSTCNFSARFPRKNELLPLSSCTKCQERTKFTCDEVTQTSVVSEKKIPHFIARLRLFNLEGNDITVCPKYRLC